MRHTPETCYHVEEFNKKLQSEKHRDTMVARLAMKGSNDGSCRTPEQPNASGNVRTDRQAPIPHGQVPVFSKSIPPMQQGSVSNGQQVQHMYNCDTQRPYSSDHVYPWQLQGVQTSVQNGPSLYGSGQFFQSPSPQHVLRSANVSQTVTQGSTVEGQPKQFFDPRSGPNPIILQVSPQSQVNRQVESKPVVPSDQGIISIGQQTMTSSYKAASL